MFIYIATKEKETFVCGLVQAIELLRTTPNLRMEFARFVPAYHAHFGRQLRVAHYGCVKLAELFELIPEAVSVCGEMGGERSVRLAPRPARPAVAHRLRALPALPLQDLAAHYAHHYGAPPQVHISLSHATIISIDPLGKLRLRFQIICVASNRWSVARFGLYTLAFN